jgi:GR25 family glycosyltransferase involved in LPS biosynthesis
MDTKIDYYVIHIYSNLERYTNIQNMANKINKNINIFDAITGLDILNNNNINLDIIKLIDTNIVFNFKYKYINEVGCYLSHLLLIKSLLNTEYLYTLIFEDDFLILNNDFNNKLNNILDKITDDFDILYIGNLNNNHGNNYKDEIYEIDINNYLTGTHAYIINNININKIYENILTIDLAIDNKYTNLIISGKIKAYIIYPVIVSISNIKSTIR